jgi:hypothetical protein
MVCSFKVGNPDTLSGPTFLGFCFWLVTGSIAPVGPIGVFFRLAKKLTTPEDF